MADSSVTLNNDDAAVDTANLETDSSCQDSDKTTGFTNDQIELIGEYLRDKTKPLKGRFRALFVLRNISNELSLQQMLLAFEDDSELLRHEIAYCIGQMGLSEAVDPLEDIVSNLNNAPIVRHEACEALGAIGTLKCADLVLKFRNDPVREVAETCVIAFGRLTQYYTDEVLIPEKNEAFGTIDPAFALTELNNYDDLEDIYLNECGDLYQRYRAMFSLRNKNTPKARDILCKGFSAKSALFKHEVAFVLGQLANEDTIPSLAAVLADSKESGMVRHEAAEALGAIGTQECKELLESYLEDPERLVRESCEVALDMCEYEMSKDLHYADANSIIQSVEQIHLGVEDVAKD